MNKFFEELKRRNVVRVGIAYVIVGWVIAQVVDLAADNFNAPDWVPQMILIGLLLGLPLALLLSWAYEVTPEGVKKTKDVNKSKSLTHGTGKRINGLIFVGFLLALGFIGYQNFWLSVDNNFPVAEAGQASIAVLPFADLSAAGDQEYFGDGVAEEILNVLAKVDGIKVAGRTSSFQFKGQNPDLRMVGETLGVEQILEGSIRTDGNMVRVTAQLINARDGFHIWSETYDREMTSIFAIQDEIAENIATALLGTLGAGLVPSTNDGGTQNAEAYDLYLQAKFVRANRTEETLKQAEGFLLRALELDPNYANAWGALAKVYTLLDSYRLMLREEALPKLQEAAEKALALQPENSEALASLSVFGPYNNYDILGAKEFLDRAVKSNPNDIEARHWQLLNLDVLGDMEESLARARETWELDPYYWVTLNAYLVRLQYFGFVEESRKVLAGYQDGQFGEAIESLVLSYLQSLAFMEGDLEAAMKYLEMAEELDGQKYYWERYALTGLEEDKEATFATMLKSYQEGEVTEDTMAALYVYFGDYEKALPHAQQAFIDRPLPFLLGLIESSHPAVDPRVKKFLYNDNSYVPLLEHMPEVVAAYERAKIDIYEMLEVERPADE